MINVDDIVITPRILNRIAEIDWFTGAWTEGYQRKLTSDDFKAMRDIARIKSIMASVNIYGVKFSNKDIENILNNTEKKTSLMLAEEWCVKGYNELLDTIYGNYNNTPLSENYVKQFNQILFKYSTDTAATTGEYQNRSKVEQLKELLDWTNRTLNDGYFHPIITIGVFAAHFWTINPFVNGGDRLLIALIIYLLLKNGYTYIQYDSLETIIDEEKYYYDRAINETRYTIEYNNPDYDNWLDFFTKLLIQYKDRVKETIRRQLTLSENKLSTTSRKILEVFVNNYSYIGMGRIVRLTKLKEETVRKAVRLLVKKGVLTKRGSTNKATYCRNI